MREGEKLLLRLQQLNILASGSHTKTRVLALGAQVIVKPPESKINRSCFCILSFHFLLDDVLTKSWEPSKNLICLEILNSRKVLETDALVHVEGF